MLLNCDKVHTGNLWVKHSDSALLRFCMYYLKNFTECWDWKSCAVERWDIVVRISVHSTHPGISGPQSYYHSMYSRLEGESSLYLSFDWRERGVGGDTLWQDISHIIHFSLYQELEHTMSPDGADRITLICILTTGPESHDMLTWTLNTSYNSNLKNNILYSTLVLVFFHYRLALLQSGSSSMKNDCANINAMAS